MRFGTILTTLGLATTTLALPFVRQNGNGTDLYKTIHNPLNQTMDESIYGNKEFKYVVVFGDALSDDTNLYKATNETYPPDPPYWRGRFTNGRTWPDYFSREFDAQVINLAWGGAQISDLFPYNNDSFPGSFIPPTIVEQISQYLNNTPALPPNSEYSSKAKNAASSLKNLDGTLFVIWGGANDYLEAARQGKTADPWDVVGALRNALGDLGTAGAQSFVIMDLPPFRPDILPLKDHTVSLDNEVLSFALEFPNATILTYRPAELFDKMLDNPREYGLKNYTLSEPCLSIDWNGTAVVCNDPYSRIMYDETHPSHKVQRVIGADLAETILNEKDHSDHEEGDHSDHYDDQDDQQDDQGGW
ncbi:hypothetical protein HDU85_007056 [Gaertneriomyces sp. JEL0708]|nr:hypothetical protein HDU85_007056 [Gaertneriomyces sp. JEL0708]